jgi:hypothetical protein
MLDIKQVLVYCALNFSSKSFDIQRVCLFNPREGLYFAESVNDVCQLAGGRSAFDILGELVEYISDSDRAYGIV